MNEKNPMLVVEDLRVSYHTYAGEVKAVRGVSFAIKEGEARNKDKQHNSINCSQ